MKRFLSFLFLLILALGLVACGETETSTDSATGSTATGSDDSGDSSNVLKGYDDSIEHMFIATDITNHSIVIYDLDLCEGDFQLLTDDDVALVWEWDPAKDPNCKGNPGAGIDSAKYRYSPYYERDVIIACSSGGWAGVIDYEKKTVLWEYNIGGGPHSIEMMPDSGDIIVACSGGAIEGKLSYVPLSAGETKPSCEIKCPSGHGVMWDPQNEHLWVLEFEQVFACVVEGEGTKNAKIKRLGGTGASFDGKDASGHAFSPVLGQPGKYWVSAGKLWQFDAATETLTRSFNRAASYNAPSIKGICSFADGTVVETVAEFGGETTYDWSCGGFRIITMELTDGKVQTLKPVVTEVFFDTDHREFYKVQPFTKDYQ